MCSLRATNRGLSSMTLCLLLVTMSSSPSMSRKSACISPTRYFENIPPSLMLPRISSCMILPLAIMAIPLPPPPMSSCLFAVPTHPPTLYPLSPSTVPPISSLRLHRRVTLSPSLPMYQTYSRLFRWSLSSAVIGSPLTTTLKPWAGSIMLKRLARLFRSGPASGPTRLFSLVSLIMVPRGIVIFEAWTSSSSHVVAGEPPPSISPFILSMSMTNPAF